MGETPTAAGRSPGTYKSAPENNRVFVGSSEHARLSHENAMLRATIAELEELNKRDPLTGLFNKNAYPMVLQSEYGKVKMNEQKSLGVVRIDLDNFSWVNDFLGGHHFGDLYLTITSNLLQKHFRSPEDTAYRVGGDEFALLMAGDFSGESFDAAVTRLHTQVNGKALTQTLDVLGRSHRMIRGENGKPEREGTVALKELLHGIHELRDNTDGARDHFLEHGRGSPAQKNELLRILDAQELTVFDAYRADLRTEGELTPAEIAGRRATEKSLSGVIAALFPSLTISMAGLLVTPDTTLDPLAVDKKADMMVGSLKRRGGSATRVAIA